MAAQPAQRIKQALSWLLTLALVAFVLATPFGFLWLYAQWGGSCLERGGHIEGAALETHCEGSKP